MTSKKLCSPFFLLALLTVLAQGCVQEKGINQQEALDISQDFVNEHVKFFVDESGEESKVEGVVVSKLSITVTNIEKKDDEWFIELIARTGNDTEVKKAGVIVVIDAKTGEVNKDKLRQFQTE